MVAVEAEHENTILDVAVKGDSSSITHKKITKVRKGPALRYYFEPLSEKSLVLKEMTGEVI